ncbi:hypothetical protein K488DRAFT_72420 [Vararia minispora EC-137]|uniref:Uncharacterized protein n=1 Tax=Vararia minispora EC-137 TaxID=1314806 RepID=A0ACB8QEA4_9AGAM|nr:hypothetical protein K488DRAFT_72420 [Vararia minispora EC-137]
MASSSLSSVVSTLVRAQMGSSVPNTVADDDLDRHVAELILKEAKQKAEKYAGKDGIRAFLPQYNWQESSAPRTNKRFLSNIIRNTDDHNKSILRAQALSAAEIRAEKDEQERKERKARAEEAVEAERLRRSGGYSSSRRQVERDSERRTRRGRSWERRGLGSEEEEDEGRYSRRKRRRRGGEDEQQAEVEDNDRHRSSRHHRRRRRETSEEKSPRRRATDRRRHPSPAADERSVTPPRSDGADSHRKRRRRHRSPSPEDDSRRRKRSRHAASDSRRTRRRRSASRLPSPSPARRSASVPRSETLSETRARQQATPERSDAPDVELEREAELRRRLKGKGRAVPVSDAPPTPPPEPSSPPSPGPPTPPPPPPLPRTRAIARTSSRPPEPSAPAPPLPSTPPRPPPLPAEHFSEPALPSKMDKYFDASYDPRLDTAPLSHAPHVPATGLVQGPEFDGWDAMLELIRARREDKAERKRLERLGVVVDKKATAHGGMVGWGEGPSAMDITYKKRGAVREWDLCKETPT